MTDGITEDMTSEKTNESVTADAPGTSAPHGAPGSADTPGSAGPVPLSVLDLVSVSSGSGAAEAIEASVRSARAAEEAGYRRYWVAEHHNTASVASSATSVLMGRLAQETSTIRIGSGGIMLPNHAPLRVAEDIGTLAVMYPDRIDLGLGRAPGTDPETARQLRRGRSDVVDFASDIGDLQRFLAGARPEAQIIAHPGQGTNVPLYVLGSSTGGASVAAQLGLPLVLAAHFAPHQVAEAMEVYRRNFRADAPTAQIDEPWLMVAVNTMVADTEEEAEFHFSVVQQMFLQMGKRSGARRPLPPPSKAPNALATHMEWERVKATLRYSFVGTADQVVGGLRDFAADADVDEIMTVTYAHDPDIRLNSVISLGRAWNESDTPHMHPR